MPQLDLVVRRKFGLEEAACDWLRRLLAVYVPVGRPQLFSRRSVSSELPAFIELVAVITVWRLLVPAAAAYMKRLAERVADATWEAVRSRQRRTRAELIADIATVLAETVSTVATDVEVRFTLRLPDERSDPCLVSG